MAKRKMKLYVWEDVLCDYSCGMIVAIAPSLEKAKEIVLKEASDACAVASALKSPAKEYDMTESKAFVIWGGS